QTAVQVPVAATPTNYVAATPDVEAHLTGIDAALASGGSGEVNTASNQGTGGVATFIQKTGVDLEFRSINAGSNKVIITQDGPNQEIDIDVDESNFQISGGASGVIVPNTISQGDIGINAIGQGELQQNAVTNSALDDDAVTTTEILNGTILNEDINNAAAIDGIKINPDFGTQNITTTGNIDGAAITTTGNLLVGGSISTVTSGFLHPDYVFQKYFLDYSDLKKSYNFSSLDEIEAFIKKNHHLPGIKSAKEVQKDGFWNLSKSNLQNLEKIEELFLHTINQEKKINQLETKNQAILEELESLKKELEAIKNAIKEK
ncbi:MAG: hypothetical protein WBN20_13690, partial [Eudoraea sp.]